MVTIGVTGHRFLAEADRLSAAADAVRRHLERTYPGPWTVVSALAEGADRLVAKRLLTRQGSRLVVLLPIPRDDYEADFATPESRREFADLLARAEQVVVTPPQPDREAAYDVTGTAVVERSDVLVAVWDGAGPQGRGGTGAVVARAREKGLPLAWVHAGNRRPGTEQPTSLGAEQGRVTFERFSGLPG